MATLNWELFKKTYIRPLLNDVLEESYTEEILQSTAYATIIDMRAKGLPSLEPLPNSTTQPGLSQINYLTFSSSVRQSNIFYVFINNESVSYEANISEDINIVRQKLTDVINNSTNPAFADITATNQTFRVQIEGAPSTPFIIDANAIQGASSNNPVLEVEIGRTATKESESVDNIVNLTAPNPNAFTVIAYGIRYFLTSDPVTRVTTTSGLQINKDEDLIAVVRIDYFNSLLAYIEEEALTGPLIDYWKGKLIAAVNSNSKDLTYEQRLALLNAEYDRKIEQDDNSIVDTGTQQRLGQDNSTRNQKSLLQIQRQWQLENQFNSLNNKQATNGYWTPAGQITVSFLSDYDVDYQDTITVDLLQAPNSYFGLDYNVNASQTLSGSPIDISKYKKLELSLTADNDIQFLFYASSDGVNYSQVGTTATDTQINKEYYLLPSKYIRLEVIGTTNDTNFYIEANLRA